MRWLREIRVLSRYTLKPPRTMGSRTLNLVPLCEVLYGTSPWTTRPWNCCGLQEGLPPPAVWIFTGTSIVWTPEHNQYRSNSRSNRPTSGWKKTLDIITYSIFSMCDADRTHNSILQIHWCRWFSSSAFHFSRKGIDMMKIFSLVRGEVLFI